MLDGREASLPRRFSGIGAGSLGRLRSFLVIAGFASVASPKQYMLNLTHPQLLLFLLLFNQRTTLSKKIWFGETLLFSPLPLPLLVTTSVLSYLHHDSTYM